MGVSREVPVLLYLAARMGKRAVLWCIAHKRIHGGKERENCMVC